MHTCTCTSTVPAHLVHMHTFVQVSMLINKHMLTHEHKCLDYSPIISAVFLFLFPPDVATVPPASPASLPMSTMSSSRRKQLSLLYFAFLLGFPGALGTSLEVMEEDEIKQLLVDEKYVVILFSEWWKRVTDVGSEGCRYAVLACAWAAGLVLGFWGGKGGFEANGLLPKGLPGKSWEFESGGCQFRAWGWKRDGHNATFSYFLVASGLFLTSRISVQLTVVAMSPEG